MISIKKADLEDASDLVNIKIRAFSKEVELYGYGPPGYDSLENQERGIMNGNSFKILDDEKIIGGIGIEDVGEGHYRLGGIYIELEYQNKGIGTVAMKFLFNEFPQAVKWALETPYLSFRNHHFYEKMGFVKVGETEPDMEGFYLYLYEKEC